jgi:hypothetical protein
MDIWIETIVETIGIIIIFLILHLVSKTIYEHLKIHFKRRVNPENYLPREEIHNQRQMFYIIILLLCVIFLLYILDCHGFLNLLDVIFGNRFDYLGNVFYGNDLTFKYFDFFDIFLSLSLALNLDLKNNRRNLAIFLLLVPFGSIDTFLTMGGTLVILLDALHVFGYLYFIKVYYDKFMRYTRNNALEKSIIIFFALIVITCIVTVITEDVNILDSLNMVSNAYTSNGYDVFGTGGIGKINELAIVWGGYIFSTVGTATLAVTIIIRYYNSKIEKMRNETNKRFDRLKELAKSDEKQ